MQSDIFKYALIKIKDSLKEIGDKSFTVVENLSEGKNQVQVSVSDVFQCSNDKTGQRIIVGESRYEVPAQYIMILKLTFTGKSLEDKLSILGQVAAFFKDNNSFECGEYNWHGNESNAFFIEPVIRREANYNNKDLFLEYKIEIQVNSTKEEQFSRVKEKILNTNQIK